MEEDALKAEIKRDEAGHFLPGNPPGPGRPKGKTLKEYQAEKFRQMSDEEKEAYLTLVERDVRWKMAEGNPSNTTDITSGGQPLFTEEHKKKAEDAIKSIISTGDTQ